MLGKGHFINDLSSTSLEMADNQHLNLSDDRNRNNNIQSRASEFFSQLASKHFWGSICTENSNYRSTITNFKIVSILKFLLNRPFAAGLIWQNFRKKIYIMTGLDTYFWHNLPLWKECLKIYFPQQKFLFQKRRKHIFLFAVITKHLAWRWLWSCL